MCSSGRAMKPLSETENGRVLNSHFHCKLGLTDGQEQVGTPCTCD